MELIDLAPVVLVVGLVATTYLTAINLAAERMRLVKGSMLHAIGAFVIPEPMRSLALRLTLHFAAGVAFTGVYAYIFSFLSPGRLFEFVSIGLLVGLVHGFFVSYFMILGFSALQSGDASRPFSFPAAILNVFAHMVFGLTVGLGLGTAFLGQGVWWFVLYSVLVLVGLAALAGLFLPPMRRLRTRGADGFGPGDEDALTGPAP